MARPKYRYNPETCKYEPVIVTGKAFAKSTGAFLGASFLLGLIGLFVFNYHYSNLDEIRLGAENQDLKTQWQVLNNKLEKASRELTALELTDDNNYRVILNLEPLPFSVREAGVGGHEKEGAALPYDLIRSTYDKVEKLKNRLDIESQSFEKLTEELIAKERINSSRPAIQPIHNHNLIRLNTIFGLRLHPIFHIWRDHNGLDLTANSGVPVYAAGDGYVNFADVNLGYGQVVFVTHANNFETRYAHLSKILVKKGEYVKRGQLLGRVGSTGYSTNPHLHYEVLYKGKYINPIFFFQNDLSTEEYDKVINSAKR